MDLDKRHEKAIELLADGVSVRKIAAQLNVDERTIRRWKQDPEFALELMDALHESIDYSSRRVQPAIQCAQNMTTAAFDYLNAAVTGGDEKLAMQACRILLSYGFKWATLPLQIQKEKDKLAQKEKERQERRQSPAAPHVRRGEKQTFANNEVEAEPELNPVSTMSAADISPAPIAGATTATMTKSAPAPTKPAANSPQPAAAPSTGAPKAAAAAKSNPAPVAAAAVSESGAPSVPVKHPN